jgi:glycosyltransferase involved in cell wall biosynthesis
MQPILSIITPTYNRTEFLKECLESVQALCFTPDDDWLYEHVLVDDGSTIDIRSWMTAHMNPRMRFFRLKKNQGQSAARNYGLQQVLGKYVFMLDSDDMVTQRGIYYLIDFLEHHADAPMVYGDFLRVGPSREYLLNNDYYGWSHKDARTLLLSIFRSEHFIQHCMLFRSEVLRELGGYNSTMRIAEDLELLVRFILKGYFPRYFPVVSILARYHDQNLTSSSRGDSFYARKQHRKSLQTIYSLHHKELKKYHIVQPE